MRFTVFTPTYNRAYIIEKLYRSLQRQTFQNFEWIVIDDGSTDNTQELFEGFMMESNNFPIRYEKVENGGKHRAINRGVKMAQGELFLIVDSDDYLTDSALEELDTCEMTIPAERKNDFCGICGLKVYSDGRNMGSTFEGEQLDATELNRVAYGISGEKAQTFYTSLLIKYPFPEYPGENFITECTVWDKIAADGYLFRYFNKPVMVCEYLHDGLTKMGKQLMYRNPKGYGTYLHQSIQFGKLTGLMKWNELLDYYGSLRDEISFWKISSYVHMNPVVLWFRLLGMRVFYKLYGRW